MKRLVEKVADEFSGYGQQDAQEFKNFLLDGIHNELNRVVKKPPYEEIDCDHEPVNKQSDVWANYFKARDDSIITDLFQGQLCNTLTCTKCGEKRYKFEPFMDLPVSIP